MTHFPLTNRLIYATISLMTQHNYMIRRTNIYEPGGGLRGERPTHTSFTFTNAFGQHTIVLSRDDVMKLLDAAKLAAEDHGFFD